jgi:ERO1-like protein alpha
MLNPERFTGYAGESAHKVWRAIYEENCFGLTEKVGIECDADGSLNGGAGKGVTELKGGLGGQTSWTDPRKQQGFGTDMRRTAARDEECLEKRIYYRIISGMFWCPLRMDPRLTLSPLCTGLHASISIHICHEYLDQTTGEWVSHMSESVFWHPALISRFRFSRVPTCNALSLV